MMAVIFLFEAANKNLLLGFMPESIGLLIFGIILITFAVSLRRFFNRREEKGDFNQTTVKAHRRNGVLIGE